MCPPACTDPEEERTVSNRGLTGNLISTSLGVSRRALRPTSLPESTAHGRTFCSKPGSDHRKQAAVIHEGDQLPSRLGFAAARLDHADTGYIERVNEAADGLGDFAQ